MKKIILSLLTGVLLNSSTPAQINTDSLATPVAKNYEQEQGDLMYRKKQRTIGWVLMGAGFALFAVIFAIVQSDKLSNEKRL